MLKVLFQNKVKVFLLCVLVVLLAAVRAYENQLFYDPFLDYFKTDFVAQPLPKYTIFDLYSGLTFRFFLNSIISLCIIYVLFLDKNLVAFSAILYFVFYILLISVFFYLLNDAHLNKMTLFYVRRFIIQPLLLLLFVPAFYYQNKMNVKSH